MIHARAELLYYDPNLSYELAARVAKLEPHANAFLLNLSEWMSGEVRFTQESGHRVPHDPLIGLDRSIDLLEQVIDNALPYSNEETAALFPDGQHALAPRQLPRSHPLLRAGVAAQRHAGPAHVDAARNGRSLLPPGRIHRRGAQVLRGAAVAQEFGGPMAVHAWRSTR